MTGQERAPPAADPSPVELSTFLPSFFLCLQRFHSSHWLKKLLQISVSHLVCPDGTSLYPESPGKPPSSPEPIKLFISQSRPATSGNEYPPSFALSVGRRLPFFAHRRDSITSDQWDRDTLWQRYSTKIFAILRDRFIQTCKSSFSSSTRCWKPFIPSADQRYQARPMSQIVSEFLLTSLHCIQEVQDISHP